VALLGAVVLLLLLDVLLARRTRRLGRRIDALTRGVDGRNLEAVLDAHLDRILGVAHELDELAARAAVLEADMRRAYQRIGIVRFNPFEDTGGNQSFAITLLDGQGNGLVLSSLHGRAGTRIYAKAVSGGRSEAALSTEEEQALRMALGEPAIAGRPV
jgi:hypothetical protein